MLPNRKVKRYEYMARYGGKCYDVASINKQKKTVRLCWGSGAFVIPLTEVELILSDDAMNYDGEDLEQFYFRVSEDETEE